MIHTENLWKNFGRFEALRGLSFDVPEGSAFALIGANGAGKNHNNQSAHEYSGTDARSG